MQSYKDDGGGGCDITEQEVFGAGRHETGAQTFVDTVLH